jgi:hypothetical protein
MMRINHLVISWSTSRGRDTYGYNICRLDDRNNGKRFRTLGGGYDMIGTVFGDWLEENYQDELRKIPARAYSRFDGERFVGEKGDLYGMTLYLKDGSIRLDGGCGIRAMLDIAKAIGLEVEQEVDRRKGHLVGFYVEPADPKRGTAFYLDRNGAT